jgi:hypothetical protein
MYTLRPHSRQYCVLKYPGSARSSDFDRAFQDYLKANSEAAAEEMALLTWAALSPEKELVRFQGCELDSPRRMH